MTDDTTPLEIQRKKILFRSWHRGTREMDLLMGRFAEKTLPDYDAAKLDAFEDLLKENDPDLYNWVSGREDVPSDRENPVLDDLIRFYAQV